jgi:hypothetical protein
VAQQTDKPNVPDASQHGGHGGRASSWLAVTVMLLGFLIGGVALTLGPHWPMLWVGVGVVAVGGILALLFDIFSDVVVDAPRVVPAKEHHSPLEHKSAKS